MKTERALTDDEARKVKWLLYYSVPAAAIARKYNVSTTCIRAIKNGWTYREIYRTDELRQAAERANMESQIRLYGYVKYPFYHAGGV